MDCVPTPTVKALAFTCVDRRIPRRQYVQALNDRLEWQDAPDDAWFFFLTCGGYSVDEFITRGGKTLITIAQRKHTHLLIPHVVFMGHTDCHAAKAGVVARAEHETSKFIKHYVELEKAYPGVLQSRPPLYIGMMDTATKTLCDFHRYEHDMADWDAYPKPSPAGQAQHFSPSQSPAFALAR